MNRGPPPPGGDQNKAPVLIITHAILTGLAVITVAVRFTARTKGGKHFGWDDWTMLVALSLALGNLAVDVAETDAGYGRHMYYLDLAQIIRLRKALFVSELLCNLTICMVKISVALFLLRIGGLRKWLRVTLLATIALLVSSTSAFVIILFVQCRPISGNWNPKVALTANCLSPSALLDVSYCAAGISIFTDFLCTVLPFQIIWDLNMSRSRKRSVLALLCLGSLAMVCGIVRINYVKRIEISDPTWNLVTLDQWTTAEFTVGIIAGSIPPCRVLALQLLHKFIGKPPPSENTIGVAQSRTGHRNLLRSLSRFANTLLRSRTSSGASEGPKGSRYTKASKNSQNINIPMKPWKLEANRAVSQDSGRESILPLHNTQSANLEAGILKTVDVNIGTSEDDIGLAANKVGRQSKEEAGWKRY